MVAACRWLPLGIQPTVFSWNNTNIFVFTLLLFCIRVHYIIVCFPYIILGYRNAHPGSNQTPDHPKAPERWCGFVPCGHAPRRGREAERWRWWQGSVRSLLPSLESLLLHRVPRKPPGCWWHGSLAALPEGKAPQGGPGTLTVAGKSGKSVPREAVSHADAVTYYKQQAVSHRPEDLHFTGVSPFRAPSGHAKGLNVPCCWSTSPRAENEPRRTTVRVQPRHAEERVPARLPEKPRLLPFALRTPNCTEVWLSFLRPWDLHPLNTEINFILEAVSVSAGDPPAQFTKDPNNSNKPAVNDFCGMRDSLITNNCRNIPVTCRQKMDPILLNKWLITNCSAFGS